MFIHFLPMQHGDFPVRKLWKITRGQSFRNDHSIIRIYQNIISIVLPMFNAQLLYTHSIPILLDIYIYTHYLPIIYICIYIHTIMYPTAFNAQWFPISPPFGAPPAPETRRRSRRHPRPARTAAARRARRRHCRWAGPRWHQKWWRNGEFMYPLVI